MQKICIFNENRAFSGRKSSKSGVIYARNDLLRELFAANVQCIKSVRAVGTVFEEVFLGLGKLLTGFVFVEAVASVQYSGRLYGEDKIIVILTLLSSLVSPTLDVGFRRRGSGFVSPIPLRNLLAKRGSFLLSPRSSDAPACLPCSCFHRSTSKPCRTANLCRSCT